jgi:hypothetical protein
MKILRKGKNCLNCGLELDSKFSYCPQCGQENTDNKVSLMTLIGDTILNYFSFDVLFGRSLLPFLFKPGYLVNEFLEGKRVSHIHPVRLYLIVNFFFFLIFVKTIDLQTIEKELALTEENNQPVMVDRFFIYNGQDTTVLSMKELADSLNINRKKLKGDSLRLLLEAEVAKTKPFDNYEFKKVKQKDTIINLGDSKKGINWQKVVKYIGKKNMSPEAFLDSIGWQSRTPRVVKSAEQAMKIGRNDLSIFILNVINNIPLMMILMLPLIAFYLKLFYVFSKRLYIEHLVFTFYFQAFNYVLLGAILLILNSQKEISDEMTGQIISWFMFIWVSYNFIAFRRVYRQSWWVTLWKIFWVFSFYVTTLSFFLLLDLLYSFFTY